MRVLCVGVQRDKVPEAARLQIEEFFGADIEYEFVEPQTPQELAAMTLQAGAVAVYLAEPALAFAMEAAKLGRVPCVTLDPTDYELVQIYGVRIELGPVSLRPE